MCMCGRSTINGEPGYSWNGEAKTTRPVQPPDLLEGGACVVTHDAIEFLDSDTWAEKTRDRLLGS